MRRMNDSAASAEPTGMTDEQIDHLVRRTYQYVAMYNVINKNAMVYASQTGTDGWNLCSADTELKDHTYQAIARPNNDTLYAGCTLDLRAEPGDKRFQLVEAHHDRVAPLRKAEISLAHLLVSLSLSA